MSEWCQNKKCPQKKTQAQVRGTKGKKYYQSNKASRYYDYWWSMGCREEWWKEHKTTCINAVGFIDKQVLTLEDCWYVYYVWGSGDGDDDGYKLVNKLLGVNHTITRQQAQTPAQLANRNDWQTIDDTQAKELAQQLGLTNQ